MRYPEDQKARTRQRILDEAARAFRREGIGATGLQPLMKQLGLTHGGFYAHFSSKEELVALALQQIGQQWHDRLEQETEPPCSQQLIEHYLSEHHRDTPEEGCPLPGLCYELSQRGRSSPETDRLVRHWLERLDSRMAGQDDSGGQAVLMLSAMTGALLISRCVTDRHLSDRILAITRQALLAMASTPGPE